MIDREFINAQNKAGHEEGAMVRVDRNVCAHFNQKQIFFSPEPGLETGTPQKKNKLEKKMEKCPYRTCILVRAIQGKEP